MKKKDYLVVINPQAGKGKALAYGKRIEKLFISWGVKAVFAFTCKDGPNSAFALGKKAAEEGIHTIVAVGGDGTKNLLFNGMMASGVPLERLPQLGFVQAGTGNNFAKNLSTPSAFGEAMEVIKYGYTILVDVGLVTSKSFKRYFLNVVSFGFDAEVVEKTSRFKEKRGSFIFKELAYLLVAGQKIFQGFPSYRLSLSSPGFTLETDSCLLAVLNGPTYGAIFNIAPGADLSDGLFDAYLVDKVNKIKALGILLRATQGKHVGLAQVGHFKTGSLNLASLTPLPCEVDGEVMPAEKEYQISILPRALKVLVPPPFVEAKRPLAVKVRAPEFQLA